MPRSAMSRWIAGALAGALLVTLAQIPRGTRAHAASDPVPNFGAQFHATWSDYTDEERVRVLDMMAAAGIRWVRIDLGWSTLQPTGPDSLASWYLEDADFVVDAAKARGINVLMTLWRTPSWANGGADFKVPPTDPNHYGDVAQTLADHFNGRVAAWEVWNEPNHRSFWSGTPQDYAAMVKASYSRFKAGDPSATVVAGSVSYNDVGWLEQMYMAGAQGSFDALSTHPYQSPSDQPPEAPDNGTMWRLSHVSAVHELMTRYGDGERPIWFTEFGWSSHANDGTENNWDRGVTLEQQADYAVRALAFVAQNYPYVTHMFWYNERNRDAGDPQIDNYGLLYRDLSPKPVYAAVALALTTGSLPQPVTAPKNLLSNGGFERGTTGWATRSARLRVVSPAYAGGRAGKVTGRRRTGRLRAGGGRAGGRRLFELNAFVKPRARGQVVNISILEQRRGRTIGSRRMWLRTKGWGWQAIPSLRYRSTGRGRTRIVVEVRPFTHRRRGVFLDGFALTRR